MNYRRDIRNSSSAIFDDGLEEGGLRASSSYSHDINDHDNDKDMDCLQDRVIFLKRLTGDIHEEVKNHNHLLDRMDLSTKQIIDRGSELEGLYVLDQQLPRSPRSLDPKIRPSVK
ncbi:bet1-like SNARE 1-1 isoform X3 [Manihot esculenta]|uniref:bet1-like SNARE 1-1 isoform X3 n=1 Tax=Manihot esculenta TaxID=3983 RepID=UPI001CC3FB7A|nr:bet1-like SNARE 1-1 isoform X3 [Manihot esculenta]